MPSDTSSGISTRALCTRRHGSVGEKRYGRQLLDWADGYAAQGWPSSTPWYLVRTLDDLVRHVTGLLISWAVCSGSSVSSVPT